ncbi:MAG: SUMF1/EgtB/PvdO family nonheme iron enzyme [Candidatus Competibacteraceae bacterium]
MKGLKIWLLGLSVLLSLSVLSFAEDSAPWPEKYYNPKPAADDSTLPMPCGGAMVFRPIAVFANGWLGDRRTELGQSDPRVGYKEGRHTGFIAGSFSDPGNPKHRFYYLAKYETTQDQYAALSGQCPQPTPAGLLPKVDLSWFEAVDFARRYSEWLLQHARERLPKEGEQLGFLRLPTEVEWEYAARGGASVDEAAFVGSLFPMADNDLSHYVWYQGTQSAAGRLQQIGLLEPNPLGLYDILGNAAEMIFVPFQLDRRGRLHGQAGGFIAKGGDIFTSRSQMRTSLRDEQPYFDPTTGQARRLRTLGFRLVLTTPVLVSSGRLQEIQEEWTQLPDLTIVAGSGARQSLESLAQTASQSNDDRLRAQLEIIQRDLEKAYTESNEARDRAVKALLRMGAFLGNKVKSDKVRLDSVGKAIEMADTELKQLEQTGRGRPDLKSILKRATGNLAEMKESQGRLQTSLKNSFSYYGDMVIDVAGDYPVQVIEPQLEILKLEFKSKQSDYLTYYADLFVKHIKDYQSQHKADSDLWLQNILEIGERKP